VDALGRDLSAMSQAAGRLRRRMEDDEILRERVKRIGGAVEIPIYQA